MLLCACKNPEDPATRFHRKARWAASAFPVPEVSVEEVAARPDHYLLVDTRAGAEFAVSRLPRAILWEEYQTHPPPEAVRQALAEDRPVVFYCSIGYRSGEAAFRARELLGQDANVLNLYGGIFRWANEGNGLEGGELVHPYDDEWGRLLEPEVRYPRGGAPGRKE